MEIATHDGQVEFIIDVGQFSTKCFANSKVDSRLEHDTVAAEALANIQLKVETQRSSQKRAVPELFTSPEFEAASQHRLNGVERQVIIATQETFGLWAED